MIGTRWAANCHVPCLQSRSDARLVALCGRDQERTREAAGDHGIESTYADYREMLEKTELGTGSQAASMRPDALIDAIVRDRPADSNFLDGLRAQRVIDAAIVSDQRGEWVSVQSDLA